MGALTKADFLRGTRNSVEVTIEGIEGTILLRPLSDGEYQHAKNITMKALRAAADLDAAMKSIKEVRKKQAKATAKGQAPAEPTAFEGMTIEFDMGAFTEAEFESKVFMVSRALSVNEVWTTDDVKSLSPIGVIDKLIAKVYEVSNITETMEDLVKSFR